VYPSSKNGRRGIIFLGQKEGCITDSSNYEFGSKSFDEISRSMPFKLIPTVFGEDIKVIPQQGAMFHLPHEPTWYKYDRKKMPGGEAMSRLQGTGSGQGTTHPLWVRGHLTSGWHNVLSPEMVDG